MSVTEPLMHASARPSLHLAMEIDLVSATENGRRLVDLLIAKRPPPRGHNPFLWARLVDELAGGVPEGWLRDLAIRSMQITPQACHIWLEQRAVKSDDDAVLRLAVMIAACIRNYFRFVDEQGLPPTFPSNSIHIARHLEAMARTMRDFSNQLIAIEKEAVRRGEADTTRGRGIRRLTSSIAENFVLWVRQAVPLDSPQADALGRLLPTYEVNSGRYLRHKAPLLKLFSGYATYLERLAAPTGNIAVLWRNIPEAYGDRLAARNKLLCELADIWREITGCQPTYTHDEDNNRPPSPFVHFVWSVLAYQMGLPTPGAGRENTG